jgi:2-oxoglutarate-dependent dioxygenase
MKAGLRAFFDLDDAKCCNSNVITGCGTSRPAPPTPLYEAYGLLNAAAPVDVDAFCALVDAPPGRHTSAFSTPRELGGAALVF